MVIRELSWQSVVESMVLQHFGQHFGVQFSPDSSRQFSSRDKHALVVGCLNGDPGRLEHGHC